MEAVDPQVNMLNIKEIFIDTAPNRIVTDEVGTVSQTQVDVIISHEVSNHPERDVMDHELEVIAGPPHNQISAEVVIETSTALDRSVESPVDLVIDSDFDEE